MKPSATSSPRAHPLGAGRLRALRVLADHWALWIVLAVDERDGSRFSDLAHEPGLSRRVLTERLRLLQDEGLLRTEQYSVRPVRHRYLLTERGAVVRRLALATVHVVAGGVLDADPLALQHPTPAPGSDAAIEAAGLHPADRLLAGDLEEARRIHAETIEPLERYDQQYATSLVETLATWLACDASVSVAAAKLFAHRHTVRYRLDRVRELTGLDSASSADRERLALGLRARRVLQERHGPS
ncbi:MAG: transcriptional regulator, CdaR family [Thermoleophilia bacterium]|nr:transcriptional regulator, CdaR family [Thermoleophilia bacterium]